MPMNPESMNSEKVILPSHNILALRLHNNNIVVESRP
jgi:hypothetical protein